MSDTPLRDFPPRHSGPPVRWHWLLCVAVVLLAVAASVV